MPNENDMVGQPGTGDDQAWRTLSALIAERIADGLAGGYSPKGISEIVEEELG